MSISSTSGRSRSASLTAASPTEIGGRRLDEFPHAEVVRGNKIATLPEVFALADSYRADIRYDVETKVEADGPTRSADPQEFVESIPFTETREYVQAILRNANVYRQLYGTP